MPYFDEIETLCELKQKFRKLALANHPDHGGDVRVMRDIICEYQRLAKILPDVEPSMPDAEEKYQPKIPGYLKRAAFPVHICQRRLAAQTRILPDWPVQSFRIGKSVLLPKPFLFTRAWAAWGTCRHFTANCAASLTLASGSHTAITTSIPGLPNKV